MSIGKRPNARPPAQTSSTTDLASIAARVCYVGSRKHKHGISWLGVGSPGRNASSVEQAREALPPEPFTMLCPNKWNRRDPNQEATTLLREAIKAGQCEEFNSDGFPKHAYARDPDDATIVYKARFINDSVGGYKAYPLTDVQIRALKVKV